MAFRGWPAEALEFYEGLEADNSKAYWTSHKAVYQEQVLRPMEELLEDLVSEFGSSKIFRPYRDIRFSNDKTPYKTHIGAYFWRNDLDKNQAMYGQRWTSKQILGSGAKPPSMAGKLLADLNKYSPRKGR